MSWRSRIIILSANLGAGYALFFLTGGRSPLATQKGSLWGELFFVAVAIGIPLLLGFKYISPKWGGGLRLLALFAMAMIGVLIVSQGLTLIVSLEGGLGNAWSGIVREIKSNGLFASLFGLLARQVYFFLFGILIGAPIWLPLSLMNVFLFKMLK